MRSIKFPFNGITKLAFAATLLASVALTSSSSLSSSCIVDVSAQLLPGTIVNCNVRQVQTNDPPTVVTETMGADFTTPGFTSRSATPKLLFDNISETHSPIAISDRIFIRPPSDAQIYSFGSATGNRQFGIYCTILPYRANDPFLTYDEIKQSAVFTSATLIFQQNMKSNPPVNGQRTPVTIEQSRIQIEENGKQIFIDLKGSAFVTDNNDQTQSSEIIIQFTSKLTLEQPSSSSSTAEPVIESSTGEPSPPVDSSSSTGEPSPPVDSSTAPGTGGQVTGDPQFIGFKSQSYQVHGTADTDYSIISSERLQYNAHFDFLTSGSCRQGTECFAHPGNYFGAVGVLIKAEDGKVVKINVKAGSVSSGMTVTIDGEPLSTSSKHLEIDSVNSIHFSSKFTLLIQTRDWTIQLQNSDMFLNQQIEIRQPLLDSIKSSQTDSSIISRLPHGILGQTWQLKSYPNRWQYIEGDLMNYIVNDVMSTPSQFNRFNL